MVRFAAMVAALIFFALALPGFAEGEAPVVPVTPVTLPPITVRCSSTKETVRVVLDLPAETAFIDQSTPKSVVVSLALPLATALPPVTMTDPIVTGISVTPDANGQALLTIPLAKARKCRVFTLPATKDKPFRLVVDIIKLFMWETQRALTPAIAYARLEQQTDDRYFTAHIITVQAKDRHVRLGLTAAQGERERVASMVTRANAVCGINGCYFLAHTCPVGFLKVDGQIHSLPLWGRTALALPEKGLPIFGNPTGCWKITLPDGTAQNVADWLDASACATAPEARVINGSMMSRTPANPNGVTAIVHAGTVSARGNAVMPLAPDDLALYLTGDAVKALDVALAVGASVNLMPAVCDEWDKYPNAVGAGPRLLADGKINITGTEERFQPDILSGRAARSAIGLSKGGRVFIVAIEAPGPYGGGATLEELAALLQSLGAYDAMNFDGGGSTTLAIGGETVNYPANSWVRPVASGILVFDDRYTPPAEKPAKTEVMDKAN